MRVQFFNTNGDLVATRVIDGFDDFEVCERAWSLISSGEIEADDFQLLRE